jgi:hypothetical protein
LVFARRDGRHVVLRLLVAAACSRLKTRNGDGDENSLQRAKQNDGAEQRRNSTIDFHKAAEKFQGVRDLPDTGVVCSRC